MNATLEVLQQELEVRIQARTGRQVQNLAVELAPERLVLRGRTATYYAKQLAQHEALVFLPHLSLENAIVVHRHR